MWKYPLEDEMFKTFGKYAKIAGVIFIILGVVGIVYPVFMTMATVTFITWLMLFAGFMAGYFTYFSNKSDSMGWLKSFTLIGVALFILFYPMSGAGTLGLLLAIFFLLDGFTGFRIAFSMRQSKGSILWFMNALFSFLMAILFLINWPFSSMYLVGLLVGFSLFFDGIALLVGGSIFTKMSK